jgi:hypothetical protein
MDIPYDLAAFLQERQETAVAAFHKAMKDGCSLFESIGEAIEAYGPCIDCGSPKRELCENKGCEDDHHA